MSLSSWQCISSSRNVIFLTLRPFPSRNQTSLVNLKLLRNGEKVDQVVYGKDYMLRADITHPDGKRLRE